jgi:hypothetical protein
VGYTSKLVESHEWEGCSPGSWEIQKVDEENIISGSSREFTLFSVTVLEYPIGRI